MTGANPLGTPTCPGCGAIRMPGAPMCLSCWMPFEDEPVAAAAVAAPAAVTAPPGHPAFAQTAPPEAGNPDRPPVGTPPGWRPVVLPDSRRAVPDGKAPTRVLASVVIAAVAACALGVLFWLHHNRPETAQQFFADAFRNARPASFIPELPTLDGGASLAPDAPVDPAAFRSAYDPVVRGINSDIAELENTFDSWAEGSVTGARMSRSINAFVTDLSHLEDIANQAPPELHGAGLDLETAASDYEICMKAVLTWMGTAHNTSKTTYGATIGQANEHWDRGVVEFYQGSGLQPPTLPHPQH